MNERGGSHGLSFAVLLVDNVRGLVVWPHPTLTTLGLKRLSTNQMLMKP